MKPFPHCLDACSFALGVLLVLFHRCCVLVMNLVSSPYPWFMLISSPSKTTWAALSALDVPVYWCVVIVPHMEATLLHTPNAT
jgi:hypothetical protein